MTPADHAVLLHGARPHADEFSENLGRGVAGPHLVFSKSFIPDLTRRGRSVVDVHGAGRIGRSIVGEGGRFPSNGGWLAGDIVQIGEGIRGSLALMVTDREAGRTVAHLVPDPLGAGISWIYENDGVKAASSDLRSLRRVLRGIGIKLRKSPSYLAATIATGGGGLAGCSYEDVSPLAPGEYVRADGEGISVRRYPAVNFGGPLASLDELMDELWEDATLTVEAIADLQLDGFRISHLTGGSDSRAVLATQIGTGRARDFYYACTGAPEEPDRRISDALCAHFGLIATSFMGTVRSETARTFERSVLQGYRETDGILLGIADAGLAQTNNFIVGGGYGELIKVFYPDVMAGESPANWLERSFDARTFGTDASNRMIATEQYEALVSNLARVWEEAEAFGMSPSIWGDYLYISRRNRYFMGETSRSVSRYTPRIDPLYSPALTSIFRAAPFEYRKSGRLMMEFISRGNRDLARLPFEKPQVQAAHLDAHGLEAKPFAAGNAAPWKLVPPSGAGGPVESGWSFPRHESDLETALKRGMPVAHVVTYRGIRSRLEKILRDRRAECSEIFNVDYLLGLLSKTPGHRSVYRNLTNSYRSLIWYFDEEDG